NLNLIPASVNDEGLKRAYEETNRHTWTKVELEEYEYAQIRETDEITREMLVEENKAKQIAKIILADKEPDEKIVKYTGLTLEQIEQLRSEMKR
ncbi:MAG: hypothetical protein H7Y04_09200, partial [Verrucomicrobia bacterium]|nr:hypothetical protein [Cytophagales bacterium]